VPWGSQLRLPAFLPGSQGSATPWMWQPASLDRLSEYLWSNQPYSFVDSFKSSPLSLAGLLGPFLLTGLIVFAYWRFGETMVQSPPQAAAPTHTPEKRARLFVFLWMLVMIAGMSALPGIPDFFRIRYSIMPFPPLCILLGWMLGLFLEACRGESGRRLSRRAAVGFAALFALQLAINAGRSLHYRRELGGLEIAIDRLYTHIEKSFPADSVAATPDFLSYSWKPDHITPLHAINRLNSLADLEGRFQPGRTLVLSWNAVLDERVDTIGFFSGCPGGILFDHLFPCAPGVGAVLMRYIGRDLRYEAATTAKDSSNLPLARIAYEQFLADHPGNLAAHFWLGYTTSYLKDWQAADLHNRLVENYLPDTQGVIYNRALSLAALKQYDPAIRRLERVSKMAPNTYGVLWNLYWAYRNSGRKREAADTLATMRSLFPDDPETTKLSADM
jgi:tetratricopeptide (TPR) repeat protein